MLDIPVLYLSRYIIETRADYYKLLQTVHDNGHWEEWIFYILKGVEITLHQTILTVQKIKELMQDYKHTII